MSCCSGCSAGLGCAQSMGATAGQPFAILGMTVGPPDIDDLKKRIDPDFRATDTAVQACAALDAKEREAWTGFYNAWRQYADQNSWIQSTPPWPLLPVNAPEVYADGVAREKRLRAWQDILSPKCKLTSPLVQPSGPNTQVADLAGLVKWGVIGVVVVAGLYLVGPTLLAMRKARS